jgi:hypothetical protein
VNNNALDRYITGNYGEDQQRTHKELPRSASFLIGLTEELMELGHLPLRWTRGRHGFYTNCKVCGAFASCIVSRRLKREFPNDTCDERLARVEARRKP